MRSYSRIPALGRSLRPTYPMRYHEYPIIRTYTSLRGIPRHNTVCLCRNGCRHDQPSRQMYPRYSKVSIIVTGVCEQMISNDSLLWHTGSDVLFLRVLRHGSRLHGSLSTRTSHIIEIRKRYTVIHSGILFYRICY